MDAIHRFRRWQALNFLTRKAVLLDDYCCRVEGYYLDLAQGI